MGGVHVAQCLKFLAAVTEEPFPSAPMDSTNEQFRQVYNDTYKLTPYKAQKTHFSPQEYYKFAIAQHRFLSAQPKSDEIVIFLVREINERVLARYEAVAKSIRSIGGSRPVYLVTDKYYPKNVEAAYSHLRIVYFFENICFDAGFFYVNTDCMPEKLVITWDRCLFFLSQYKNLYEKAWILEDDVAIRGAATLGNFFQKYTSDDADFLAGPPQINEKDPHEWPLWAALRDSGLPNLWATYNPIVRVSGRFMDTLADFVKEKHRLFFLEIFFISLAMCRGLKYTIFRDLHTHFRFTPVMTFEETQVPTIEFPIFHPVKDMDLWDKIWSSG